MRFQLDIDMDNAAFEDGAVREVERILHTLRPSWSLPSENFALGDEGSVRDINGNTVGSWRVVLDA